MNNIIAIVAIVVFIVLIVALLKSKFSAVTGRIRKLPLGTSIVVLIVLCVMVVLLFKYLLSNTFVHGNPGNSDATVAEEGNTHENEDALVDSENTIILSGDQIWIEDKKVDLDEAEMYIDGFSGTENKLIVIDDYSTSYLYHLIADICDRKNVKPTFIEKDEF